jgi:hypothetical protein
MNHLSALNIEPPEYLSLQQALFWLIEREPILSIQDFKFTQADRIKFLSESEVQRMLGRLYLECKNGNLSAIGKKTNFEQVIDHNGIRLYLDPSHGKLIPDNDLEKINLEDWLRCDSLDFIPWQINQIGWYESAEEIIGFTCVKIKTSELISLFGTDDQKLAYGISSKIEGQIKARSNPGKQKNRALLDFFTNHLRPKLQRENKDLTIGNIREFFEPYSSRDGYEGTPDCDDIYIDGDDFCFTVSDGNPKSLRMRSLEPYIAAAKS